MTAIKKGNNPPKFPTLLRLVSMLILLAAFLLVIACAGPTLYNVNLRYVPTDTAPTEMKETKSTTPLTVALFQDIRTIDDRIVIGRVVATGEKPIPVLPKYKKPTEAVGSAVGDVLIRNGFTVSVTHPDWNLQEDSIDKSWGSVLLGGTINDLFVECDRSGPIKKYRARVNITFVLADIKTKRILYKVSVESAPSRDHIRFSEIMMEKELNRALSEAVERVFSGSALLSHIENIYEGTQ